MTCSKHSLSSELVAKNVKLLTKILLRLPAKSLVRFKCVSKHWLSLVSDSEFSNSYTLKKFNPGVTGVYLDSHPLINFKTNLSNGLPKFDFLAKSFRVKPIILHSCNGLILCFCGPEMVVCNLTTQKFKVIPLLARHSKKSILDTILAFNTMRSPHYEIVLVIAPFSITDCISIDIYSSESGIWKNIRFGEPLFNESQFNIFTHGVLCNGVLYWAFSVNNLVRFDIDEEKLKAIQVSFEPHILNTNIMYFGEYGGRLFLAQTTTFTETEFRMFEMDMQNFRWDFKFDMKLEPVIDIFYHISNHHSVNLLCFKRGDEEETPTLLLIICEKIYLYNPESKCFKILEDFPGDFDDMTDFELLRAHNFIESLASP